MYTLDLFSGISNNQCDDCIWVQYLDISKGLILNSDIHVTIGYLGTVLHMQYHSTLAVPDFVFLRQVTKKL